MYFFTFILDKIFLGQNRWRKTNFSGFRILRDFRVGTIVVLLY